MNNIIEMYKITIILKMIDTDSIYLITEGDGQPEMVNINVDWDCVFGDRFVRIIPHRPGMYIFIPMKNIPHLKLEYERLDYKHSTFNMWLTEHVSRIVIHQHPNKFMVTTK